jgi:hypothetical protein
MKEASSGRSVLGYEGAATPPCVVRSPGRVALLLPPPPRWVVMGSVLIFTAVWLASMGMTGWIVLTVLRRPVWRNAWPAGLFLGAMPLVLTFLFAGVVVWWARGSRRAAVLEVVGHELVYSTPGMWRTHTWRAPMSRVKAVEVRAVPFMGRSRVQRVEVRVKLNGWWWWPGRYFYTSDPAIASEAQKAFEEVLTSRRDEI